MLEVRNQEWLAANAARAYPLTADATQQDATGGFAVPQDFLVELSLSVHAGMNINPANFFIRSIGAFASGYSIVVGYNSTSGVVPVASALIARAAQTRRNTPYRLSGLGDFLDVTGHVVIGSLESIDQQPAGQWTFTLAGSQLEQDAICPNIRNVTSLQIQNGTQLSPRIYGDVILQAGNNFRIDFLPGEDEGEPATLIFNAISGDGLNVDCPCVDNALGECIHTINAIQPTPDGDFTILGDDCLQVLPVSNGIQLHDACSAPCCGCKELEAVTSALEQFGSQAATLENFLVSLEARVSQFDQVVAGSTFGDRGCISTHTTQGGS